MKLLLHLIFLGILVFTNIVLAGLILKNDTEHRPKLVFGEKNVTLTMDKPIIPTDKLGEDIKDEKIRRELEVAWGEWYADIYNELVVNYINSQPLSCLNRTPIDINFDVTRDGQIKNIEILSVCPDEEIVIRNGLASLEHKPILEFPTLSRKDINNYSMHLISCKRGVDPQCGENRSASDYPEFEHYYDE